MLRRLFLFCCFLLCLITLILVGYRMTAHQRETRLATDLALENSRFVETRHGVIHALDAGPEDGPPVLLIHGSVGWSGLWEETLTELADAGYRATAIDLPPMGLSDRASITDFSRQSQALRILAFVEADGTKPILVAHSFGAGAAAEALLTDQTAFEGAVIIAGAIGLGQNADDNTLPLPLQLGWLREAAISLTVTNPHLTQWLTRRFVYQKSAVTLQTARTIRAPFDRQGTTEALAAWAPTLLIPPQNAQSTDPAAYSALSLPVALIWGEEDTVTPPAQARDIQSALNQGTPIQWLPKVGHIPQIEAPDAFHAALLRALETVAPR